MAILSDVASCQPASGPAADQQQQQQQQQRWPLAALQLIVDLQEDDGAVDALTAALGSSLQAAPGPHAGLCQWLAGAMVSADSSVACAATR
jgi:hypothetical protein